METETKEMTFNDPTAQGVDLTRLVRRLRCFLVGHVVYPCDHHGNSLMRHTQEDIEADCHVCGKTIKASCGLELCGLVWSRKPNVKTQATTAQKPQEKKP